MQFLETWWLCLVVASNLPYPSLWRYSWLRLPDPRRMTSHWCQIALPGTQHRRWCCWWTPADPWAVSGRSALCGWPAKWQTPRPPVLMSWHCLLLTPAPRMSSVATPGQRRSRSSVPGPPVLVQEETDPVWGTAYVDMKTYHQSHCRIVAGASYAVTLGLKSLHGDRISESVLLGFILLSGLDRGYPGIGCWGW